MAEYGLARVERGTFARGPRHIQVLGMRFENAIGAFGAFTYYRPINFHPFDLAQPQEQAASGDTRILFTRGLWLIQVRMDMLTAMTASEMRQLAANLGPVAGSAPALPTLPFYLPTEHLEPNSIRYAEGPAGYAAACDWLPAAAVDFSQSPQIAVGSYDLPETDPGVVQVMVISYPTPQMARTHLAELQKNPDLEVRRSGPLLAVVHGISAAPAQRLAEAVNYDAEITIAPHGPVGIEGLPALIIGIFLLCAFIIGVAVVVGVLTGGIRVLLRRAFPDRFRSLQGETLIRLNLK